MNRSFHNVEMTHSAIIHGHYDGLGSFGVGKNHLGQDLPCTVIHTFDFWHWQTMWNSCWDIHGFLPAVDFRYTIVAALGSYKLFCGCMNGVSRVNFSLARL